jgi:hypothetical protein
MRAVVGTWLRRTLRSPARASSTDRAGGSGAPERGSRDRARRASVALASLALVAGCSSDNATRSTPRVLPGTGTPSGSSAPGLPGGGSTTPGATGSGTATGGQAPVPVSPPTAVPSGTGTATNCDPLAGDQTDCQCSTVGAVRACYTVPTAARNVGVCRDGSQACASTTGEFGAKWGPCMQETLPTTCSMDVDAKCTGKVGCADSQCASQLPCTKDAGMPDAGRDSGIPPGCRIVQGFNGNGMLVDGGLYCEGQGFFGGGGP